MSNDRNNDNYGNSHGGQHEQRANKGNSWNDEDMNMSGNNPDQNWDSGQQQQQGMGGRGNGMNNASMSNDNNYSSEQRNLSPSDNDDFNNQGWPEDEDRNTQSRTFNEDEDTYEDEQRTANSGTQNNNWDANDQTQRTSHIHDDEQWDKNEPYDSGSGL